MGLLGDLLGGLQPHEAQDFVQRYQQGSPSEGYSDQEVLQRFQQVAPQLSPQQFQQAAAQSFANMPPNQLAQFGQMLQQQAQQQGIGFPQVGGFQEPNALAQAAAQVHQQSPGLLGQLGELDPELARAERRAALGPMIEGLPEREQVMLYLRFYEGMTQSEIAKHLGISQMHVSRLLSRSLQRLRELADPE